MTEEEARKWPDLCSIVEAKVKPERSQKSKEVAAWPWWRFWRVRGELREATKTLNKVLVCCRHQPHWAVTSLTNDSVFSEALNVFAVSEMSSFSILQSRAHEIWARSFGSSMKDDLRYTPSDCFETFPFPEHFETDANLETVGEDYYEFRAALMVKNNEGLTKTYNRFHDPNETSAEIKKLRELHAAMDRAVLNAYSWTDLKPTCEFLLDYEDEDDDDGDTEAPGGRRRKKPWHYRWPDEFRDEVLTKLLDLNKKRAEHEQLSGEAHETKTKKKAGKKKDKNDHPGQEALFS
jgi:hypothetical protein